MFLPVWSEIIAGGCGSASALWLQCSELDEWVVAGDRASGSRGLFERLGFLGAFLRRFLGDNRLVLRLLDFLDRLCDGLLGDDRLFGYNRFRGNDGFRLRDDGLRLRDNGLRLRDDGLRLRDDGLRLRDDGLRLRDGLLDDDRLRNDRRLGMLRRFALNRRLLTGRPLDLLHRLGLSERRRLNVAERRVQHTIYLGRRFR